MDISTRGALADRQQIGCAQPRLRFAAEISCRLKAGFHVIHTKFQRWSLSTSPVNCRSLRIPGRLTTGKGARSNIIAPRSAGRSVFGNRPLPMPRRSCSGPPSMCSHKKEMWTASRQRFSTVTANYV
jgi:hypothetical protein